MCAIVIYYTISKLVEYANSLVSSLVLLYLFSLAIRDKILVYIIECIDIFYIFKTLKAANSILLILITIEIGITLYFIPFLFMLTFRLGVILFYAFI